jgi:glycosyltransferase involved in cell wall biosynthesis
MVAACPIPHARGTPLRIHGLANALVRSGHQVHVVAYNLGGPDDGVEYQMHRTAAVPAYRRLGPGPTWQKLLILDPLLTLRLRRLLKQVPIDVIHAHHYEGLIAARVANLGGNVPLVYDAHTLLESELPFYGPRFLAGAARRLGRALDRALPGRADHVIAVADTLREKLLELGGFAAADISVIANGVESQLFELPAHHAEEAGAEKIAVFTGNMAAYQGIDLMLRAFARVAESRTDARLRIVTESSFEPYESLASALGVRERIDLRIEPFSEAPRHLAASDVALNPRVECDGMPYKLVNYMATGKAIVSFAGSAKLLKHETNALVVPDADVNAFADAMIRLFDDPALALRLGNNARALARATLSWGTVAEKVEAVYSHMLASPR